MIYPNEAEWRREVMGRAKDALASGDAELAYHELTRHEEEGYPFIGPKEHLPRTRGVTSR